MSEWEADREWSPADVEELFARALFELNARTIEMHEDVRAIRRLLEEDEEDGRNGEGDE